MANVATTDDPWPWSRATFPSELVHNDKEHLQDCKRVLGELWVLSSRFHIQIYLTTDGLVLD